MLIGLLTGIWTLLVLKEAFPPPAPNPGFWAKIFGARGGAGAKLLAKLLAIPAFWFGGQWITAAMLADLDLAAFRPPYLAALAATYAAIVAWPLLRLIVKTGAAIR